MINEELKTFIAKMRAAGKDDTEISSELKNSGWDEAAIKQELQSKARLNLGKVKFWIWLYGIAILLFLALFIFPKDSWLGINSWAGIFIQIYIFGIVPIITLLAFGLKLLFWILRFIPHFKDSKSLKQPDRRWLLVVSTAITGTVMLWIGYLGTKVPNGGMGIIIFVLLAFLGGLLLFLSFVVAIILAIVKYFLKNVSKNRLIWVLLISVSTLVTAVLILRVIISSWYRLSSNSQPTAPISNEISEIKLSTKATKTLEIGRSAEKMPMIFVGEDNHLSKLRFDQAQQRYLVEKKIDIDLRGRIESSSSEIYAKNGEKLVRYSFELEQVNEWTPPKELEVGGNLNWQSAYFDYVLYGNNLFVLAGNFLVIFDDSLTEVSRLPLEVEKGVVKGAHNIIVYKNMAYLLDNEVRPIYVLKVDLQDVKNPKIMSSTRINDNTPNLELDYQWLDTENLKWIIYGAFGNRGGRGTRVYSLPMNVRGNSSISSIGYGLKVLSTTKNTPAWGLVGNGGQTCLARLGEISNTHLAIDICYQYPGLINILGEDEKYLLLKTMTDKREGLLVVNKSIEEKAVIIAEIKDIAAQTADLINIP